MADAYIPGFSSATLQIVLERLWDFMVREVGLLWNANDGFKRLERTLLRVQAMLDDAENKEISHKAWKVWARDLKDAAYEADDLLDEILMTSTSSSSHQVNMSSYPSFTPHKMDNIQKKVDEIAREMEFLYMSKLVGSTQIKSKERPPTGSLLMGDEHSVFGREDDRIKIRDVLLSEPLVNVSVVSIVGMAGIGKTTFAQLVYNDVKICEHFELRMWVSVNSDFDVKRITKSIIESASHKIIDLMDLDPLQVKLKSLLANKRFLLVLDDMWNENYNDWDALQAPLRLGKSGSKILITTRSQIVSKITIASHVLSLQSLSFEDCLLLFQKRAFGYTSPENIPPNLISIGMEIARKCKGVPLVAKTLGSLLNSVTDEEQWKIVLRSEIWDFQEDESNVLPALSLSYRYLPSHLKQCFAYCAVFPKGYEFEKEKLVLLWMAQGFIQAKGGRRMEDVGSGYFDMLMCKSFFQEAPVNSINPGRYVMHDLIHNLAKFVSGEECFRMEVGDASHTSISRNARHASFIKEKVSKCTYEALSRPQNLRTVLLSSDISVPIHDFPYKLFAKMNCLRVLDLSIPGILELPSSIGNLKHLRYLDLSTTRIKHLHKGLCSLYSLQTLKLNGCTQLQGLPDGMSNLTNLRHLELQMTVRLTSMPPRMGSLIDLQTLSTFVVGADGGGQIGELKGMRNLRGMLCISKLENVADIEKANQAELKNKQHLRKLKFLWRGDSEDDDVERGALAGLRPHQNIEEIQIEFYGGTMFPGWIADSSLSNLVILSLQNCRSCLFLPPLGQLPALKSLMIFNMPRVEYIDSSFYGAAGEMKGFPSLEILALENMASFSRWDGLEVGVIPRLRKLTMSGCLELQDLPDIKCFHALEHFTVSDCSQLRVMSQYDVPVSLKYLIINSCPDLRMWYQNEGKSHLEVIALTREVTIDGLRQYQPNV